jgi:hypothetical protein
MLLQRVYAHTSPKRGMRSLPAFRCSLFLHHEPSVTVKVVLPRLSPSVPVNKLSEFAGVSVTVIRLLDPTEAVGTGAIVRVLSASLAVRVAVAGVPEPPESIGKPGPTMGWSAASVKETVNTCGEARRDTVKPPAWVPLTPMGGVTVIVAFWGFASKVKIEALGPVFPRVTVIGAICWERISPPASRAETIIVSSPMGSGTESVQNTNRLLFVSGPHPPVVEVTLKTCGEGSGLGVAPLTAVRATEIETVE